MKSRLSGKMFCTLGLTILTALPTLSAEGLFPKSGYDWVGDVMAVENDNKVEFNYLYETDHNGPGYHPIHRFVTEDFCTYEDKGEIIPIGKNSYAQDFAIGTGSFIKVGDVYHCFYTGHNDRAGEYQMDKEVVMHATSTDNVNWKKDYSRVIRAPEGYSTWDFRDPQVIWSEEDGKYWMLVSGHKEGASHGCILLFKSSNLTSWAYKGELYSDNYWMLECADLFKMGDWYYLSFSWENVTHYRMSQDLKTWVKPDISTFDGNAFYAAKTVKVGNKRYLAGFIDRKMQQNDSNGYQWAGNLCVYEMVQKSDGTLGVKIPTQVEKKYFAKKSDKLHDISTVSGIANMGELPATMYMSGKLTFNGTNGQLRLKFGGKKGYSIILNQQKNSLEYNPGVLNTQPFNFEKGKTYTVKMIVENEIIVVYVDDKVAFSNRIYKAVEDDWSIIASDSDVDFSNVTFRVH